MKNNVNDRRHSQPKVEVVLGAGGVKGLAHHGFWKALQAKRVAVGKVTGVSVGALDAAFFTNGWDPEPLTDLFLERLSKRFDPFLIAQCFGVPDLLSFMIGGCADLTRPLQAMVRDFNLKPNPQLRIVAYDILHRKPVIFEGEDYDLGLALAASCAMPGVLMPVKHFSNGSYTLLVDGAMYHRNPAQFCKGTAIVSRLGFATQPSEDYQLPIDLYMHLREMYYPLIHQPNDVDEDKHVVVTTEAADVAGLNFGVSKERCLRLVDEGYAAAVKALDKAIAAGKLASNG